MSKFLLIVLAALMMALPSALRAQESTPAETPKTVERVEVDLDSVVGRKVDEVLFLRYEGNRVTNAPPTSVSRFELAREIRVQKGEVIEAGDIAADIQQMTEIRHYFEAVNARAFVRSDSPQGSVTIEYIARETRVAKLQVYALTSGWWRQARPETLYLVNSALTLDVGARYSIEQMDRDIRERMLTSGHFIDVTEERSYQPDGVHITLRVVTSQRVERMFVAGNTSVSNSAIEEEANIKDSHYAGPDTIGRVKRVIRDKYIEEGFAFVEVTHRVIKVPLEGTRESVAKAWPRLTKDVVAEVADVSDGGDMVLIFIVHEGPQVQVGEFTFKGIEELVDIPGADTLEPGKLPFNYWPVWYAANPLASRLDRVQRALYQVMQNSPGVFSPKPYFSFEQAVQDAAFLQDHLRKAGWLDAQVHFEGVNYN
ncbi:MAG: hypothetical protein KDB07_05390 [Planctomycetes bacterium]|nr:hypothetical protein [Planctomycetota bacterium]